MKAYYLIKAYGATCIDGKFVERYHYFGKSNKLIGYITEAGVKRYSKDDIRDHGYKNYKKAMEAADALRHEEIGPGWTIVVSLIAEVA